MAFPVVNIRPRVLPQAVPTRLAEGVQAGADILLQSSERRRAEEDAKEAAQIGFEREQDITTLRAAENRQTQLEVQAAATEGRIKGIQESFLGQESLAKNRFTREQPNVERGFGIREQTNVLRGREIGIREELGGRELGLREAEFGVDVFNARTRAREAENQASPLFEGLINRIGGNFDLTPAELDRPEVQRSLENLARFGRTGLFGRPEDLSQTGGAELGITRAPPGTAGVLPDQPNAGGSVTGGNEENLRALPAKDLAVFMLRFTESDQRQIMRIVGPEKARAAQIILEQLSGAEGR